MQPIKFLQLLFVMTLSIGGFSIPLAFIWQCIPKVSTNFADCRKIQLWIFFMDSLTAFAHPHDECVSWSFRFVNTLKGIEMWSWNWSNGKLFLIYCIEETPSPKLISFWSKWEKTWNSQWKLKWKKCFHEKKQQSKVKKCNDRKLTLVGCHHEFDSYFLQILIWRRCAVDFRLFDWTIVEVLVLFIIHFREKWWNSFRTIVKNQKNSQTKLFTSPLPILMARDQLPPDQSPWSLTAPNQLPRNPMVLDQLLRSLVNRDLWPEDLQCLLQCCHSTDWAENVTLWYVSATPFALKLSRIFS